MKQRSLANRVGWSLGCLALMWVPAFPVYVLVVGMPWKEAAMWALIGAAFAVVVDILSDKARRMREERLAKK